MRNSILTPFADHHSHPDFLTVSRAEVDPATLESGTTPTPTPSGLNK